MGQRTEARRLAILEAAKHVFLERGYGDASMAEIAARAGGSKPTLYGYFRSKEDLFVAVMVERGAALIEPVFDAFEAHSDLTTALTALARELVRFLADPESLAFRRIICSEGARSSLGRTFYESGPKRGWTRVADRFSQAMATSEMRPADPWRATHQFRALCEAGPIQGLLEGSVSSITDHDLKVAADGAVEVFTRAYTVDREGR